MSHDNTALARRWFEEVWNQRRTETIDEVLTPDSVCQSTGGLLRGQDEFRNRAYLPLTSAFPDFVASPCFFWSQPASRAQLAAFIASTSSRGTSSIPRILIG